MTDHFVLVKPKTKEDFARENNLMRFASTDEGKKLKAAFES
jgi:hypothetical protein